MFILHQHEHPAIVKGERISSPVRMRAKWASPWTFWTHSIITEPRQLELEMPKLSGLFKSCVCALPPWALLEDLLLSFIGPTSQSWEVIIGSATYFLGESELFPSTFSHSNLLHLAEPSLIVKHFFTSLKEKEVPTSYFIFKSWHILLWNECVPSRRASGTQRFFSEHSLLAHFYMLVARVCHAHF